MKASIISWTRSIRCMTNTKGGIKMSKYRIKTRVRVMNGTLKDNVGEIVYITNKPETARFIQSSLTE